MLLFHGTTDAVLDEILKNGILPRAVTKSVGNFGLEDDSANKGTPSFADRVYLSDAYAPYFGACAAKTPGAKPIMLAIDTDKLAPDRILMGDEDAIEQVDRAAKGTKLKDTAQMYERTLEFGENAEYLQEEGLFTFQQSLQYLGTCACKNGINPEAILGYTEFHRNRIWQIFDPTITLMNYRFMKDYYRYACKYAWDGIIPDDLDPKQLANIIRWPGRTLQTVNDAIDDIIITRVPTLQVAA